MVPLVKILGLWILFLEQVCIPWVLVGAVGIGSQRDVGARELCNGTDVSAGVLGSKTSLVMGLTEF